MSWDLYVADIPDSFLIASDVPDGWRPPIIGKANELIDRLRTAFPEAEFSSPDFGEIISDDYAIELALVPSDQPIDGFMIFVRGGESAAYAVADLVHVIGCRAFDTGASDGTIFPGPDVTAGWRAWRDFRDKRLGS